MDEDPIAEHRLDAGPVRRVATALTVLMPLSGLVLAIMAGATTPVWGGILLVIGGLAGWSLAQGHGRSAGWARQPRRIGDRDGPGLTGADGTGDDVVRAAIAPVLQGLTDPVLLLDPRAHIRFANGATRQVARAARPGRHIASALRTPSLLDAIEQVRIGEPAQTVEYTVHVPFERHLLAHVEPLRLPGDANAPDAWSTLVVIRDFTALKRLEQMRADFIASASHELRTPLASLAGFIDTLRGHARGDTEARERFLQIMGDQVGRMGRLIDDLLSLSQIELNEHVPPADEVDVHDVLRDVADVLSPLAAEDDVVLAVDAEPGIRVRGDRDELVQVFQNLVHNALKYAAAGKRVDIVSRPVAPDGPGAGRGRLGGARSAVRVQVRDYGPGISREHVPRLTERFYRVDVRQSRRSGGTGLGLAIVKHIVNRHRGSLEIHSTPGEGSTFAVLLPLDMSDDAPDDPVRTLHLAPAREPATADLERATLQVVSAEATAQDPAPAPTDDSSETAQ